MKLLRTDQRVCTVEILDFHGYFRDYLHILYNRVPSLPQSLNRDIGILPGIWNNIVHRLSRG